MLIDNAFLKLPELLTGHYYDRDTFEATVVHSMATATLMELNARGVPRPFEYIRREQPYISSKNVTQSRKADLFVRLDGDAVPTGGRSELYGYRERNWLEAKAFVGGTRSNSSPQKTANVGRVINDLLRLSLLPEELAGQSRLNARFMLVVLSQPPDRYLAVDGHSSNRQWVTEMFCRGTSTLRLDLGREPKSSKDQVECASPNLTFEADVDTRTFEPEQESPGPVFWGYLMRIRGFCVQTSDHLVRYDDNSDSWTAGGIAQLAAVREDVFSAA